MEIIKMNTTVQVHEWRRGSTFDMHKPSKRTFIFLIEYDSDDRLFRYYHVERSGMSGPYTIHYDNLDFTELFSFQEINSLTYM